MTDVRITAAPYKSKPKMLKIRWVCGLCLRILHAPLVVEWIAAHILNDGVQGWRAASVTGPRCHGAEMLMLGEPKVDIFGLRARGQVVDPYEDMGCPKVEQKK